MTSEPIDWNELNVKMNQERKRYQTLSPFLKPFTRRFWVNRRSELSEAYYWLRTHTVHRYHIIDIRGEDGYAWGWIDRDHAMLLACFKLLRDFVERENPTVGLGGVEAYEHEGMCDGEREMIANQVAREKEVRAIYTWWTQDRERERAEHDDDRAIGGYDWSFNRDQEMLLRLMAVRGSLWT